MFTSSSLQRIPAAAQMVLQVEKEYLLDDESTDGSCKRNHFDSDSTLLSDATSGMRRLFSECTSSTPSRPLEAARTVTVQLYFSKATSYLYGLVFVLSFALLCNTWAFNNTSSAEGEAIGRRSSSVATYLEIFVTSMLVLEVAARIVIWRKRFLSSVANCFDLAVTGACTALLILEYRTKIPNEVDELLLDSLESIRYAARFLRLVTFAMHHRRSQLPEEDMDFSQHARNSYRRKDFRGL